MKGPPGPLESSVAAAMKDHVKLSNNLGSAKIWAPLGEKHAPVPRPDVNHTTLMALSWALGLFGADHFYARSPWTGLLKLLTGGGFMFWWLWDALQITCERDRVLLYGFSAPFDTLTGIAQGMIYEGESQYTSGSGFGIWVIFKIVLGLVGFADFFEGKFGSGIFKMIASALLMFFIIEFVASFNSGSVVGMICYGIFASMLAVMFIGYIVAWVSDMTIVLTNPADIFKKGLPTPLASIKSFKQITGQFKDVSGNTIESEEKNLWSLFIKNNRAWGIIPSKEGTSPKEAREQFGIRHKSEPKKEELHDVKEPKGAEGGNPLTAVPARAIRNLVGAVQKAGKDGIDAIASAMIKNSPAGKAAELAGGAGAVPGMPPGMPPGMSPVPGAAGATPPVPGATPPGGATPAGGAPAPGATPGGAATGGAGAVQGNPAAAATGGAAPPGLGGLGALRALSNPEIAAGISGGGTGAVKALQTLAKPQGGGARDELSTEAQILGATVIALIAGGSLKGLVDYLMVQ